LEELRKLIATAESAIGAANQKRGSLEAEKVQAQAAMEETLNEIGTQRNLLDQVSNELATAKD
jgi:hypothetical protein